MTVDRQALFAMACAPLLVLAGAAEAQQLDPAKGREILGAKCFQCHTDAMWHDQRQDARAWEANLYRMVGRGALWTTEEIKLMAAYLAADFGPDAKPSTGAK